MSLSSWMRTGGFSGSNTSGLCVHLRQIKSIWTYLLSFNDDFPSLFAALIMCCFVIRSQTFSEPQLVIFKVLTVLTVLHSKSLVDLFVKMTMVILGLSEVPRSLPDDGQCRYHLWFFCWEAGITAQQMLTTLALISSACPLGTPWSLRFCLYLSASLSLSYRSAICWSYFHWQFWPLPCQSLMTQPLQNQNQQTSSGPQCPLILGDQDLQVIGSNINCCKNFVL